MSNGSGSSREIRTMAYFDRLPRSARQALAEANFDWACRAYLRAFENGSMNAAALVKHIRKADRDLARKRRLSTWGPDYPLT